MENQKNLDGIMYQKGTIWVKIKNNLDGIMYQKGTPIDTKSKGILSV